MAWPPNLVELFRDIKLSITLSPVLARYDPGKPTFLKSNWSAEGMSYILMQPANDKALMEATVLLLKTGDCVLDTTKYGARLQPILFGSRCCTGLERQSRSFFGEAACGH